MQLFNTLSPTLFQQHEGFQETDPGLFRFFQVQSAARRQEQRFAPPGRRRTGGGTPLPNLLQDFAVFLVKVQFAQ
jgi:hypothetical protein